MFLPPGLSHAVQVADRWHLLENASTAFLAAVQGSMHAIHKAIGEKTLGTKLLTAAEQLQNKGLGFDRRRTAWPQLALRSS